jgi:hypothetical protein
MSYATWTTLRLLHYWYWQPEWEDRPGVQRELQERGVAV